MTTLAPTVRKVYRPSVATQSNKLANKESDWNLIGSKQAVLATRTRGGGTGRPSLSARRKAFVNEVDSSSEDESIEDEDDGEDVAEIDGLEALDAAGSPDDEELDGTKPENTRAILDLASLMETMDKHCRCPECNGPVSTEVKTLCIASKLELKCLNSGTSNCSAGRRPKP
jgi:hypothetical protein